MEGILMTDLESRLLALEAREQIRQLVARYALALIGNHIIELVDQDHATGVLYCRPEHEVGEQWIIMPLQYWDRYERREGQWYFKSRSIHPFYAADVLQNPADLPGRFNFPGNPMLNTSELPERWASWQEFWQGSPTG
jgi:hypothetical protein